MNIRLLRSVAKCAGLLAGGAMINVALCVLAVHRTTVRPAFDFRYDPEADGGQWGAIDEVLYSAYCDLDVTYVDAYGPDMPPEAALPEDLRAVRELARKNYPGTGKSFLYYYGWPFRFARSIELRSGIYPIRLPGGGTTDVVYIDGMPIGGKDRASLLPTRVFALLLLANSAIYAAVLFGIQVVACKALRQRAILSGRCPACGYLNLVPDSDTCPECGNAVSPRRLNG